ncbi:hypothetical protein R1480_33685 [Rhizobium brockwellii]|uniref:hypothetical protein n=1 Tax=Rhizobium brockwellii TaxID=3019932 RepID=UPI00293DCB53|nr:hypothetical protein [Rhizobium brockwellii]MDV4159351.1 hypothetical protein [Rhizobium brockwellii]
MPNLSHSESLQACEKIAPSKSGIKHLVHDGNDMAGKRRAKLGKLDWFAQLRQSVIKRILHGSSPQQIAGQTRLELHPISVSHETI